MSRIRTISVLALLLVASCDRAPVPSEPTFTPSARWLVTGAVLTVQNTNDAGPGSLRQAIADAASGDVIEFASSIAGQKVVLSSGELVIDKALTIVGSPAVGMTIDAGLTSRVVRIPVGGDATLRNLTLTAGLAPSPAFGGGFLVEGNLTLDHSTVSGNVRGGIQGVSGSTVTVVNSTISGNTGSNGGSAVHTSGVLALVNATIAANKDNDGSSVLVFNVAGSATPAILRLTNSIIADNTSPGSGWPNCRALALVVRTGRNLLPASDCGEDADVIDADPKLGPLAANGGPTKTHALLTGSPAIDAAPSCTVTDDQRYIARPQLPGGACDLGAYEFDDYVKIGIVIDPTVAVNPNTGVAIVSGTMTCSKPAQITLGASLEQTQRNARTTVVARATASMPVSCTGPRVWSLSMVPPTGAFQNGSATAALASSSADPTVAPASSTSTVKMYWGHK